eukprot:gene12362-13633_t
MEKELNASEGIPTLLEAAIRRIERLEENHGLLQMQQTDSGMGDLNRAQEETETATHQHTRPIARSTSTGENRRPFHPPMRRLPVAVTSRTTSHMAAVNQDFRRSFPSLGGSGRRDAIVPKKARRQSCVIVAPKETYTHDFCLLAQKNATKTPSLTELTRLKEAGLGKRRITFDNKKSGHGKVRQVLETIYPKMKCQNGAFEILRGERGGVSVNLVLIPMSQDGYTVPYLKEQVSSNAVLYIRPMQSDLSLSKVTENVDVSIKTTCRTCNSSISLADMKSHLSRCTSTATSSSAYFEDSSDDDCFAESFQLDCMKTSSSSTVTRPESAEASSSIQTTLAEENVWMQTLQSLFPMHKEEHLQCSVKGAKSLEEAADTLLDSYGTTDVREILPSTSSCTATKNRLKELFVARSERFGSKDLQNLLEYDAVKDFAEEQARDWFSSLVADSDDPLQKDDPTYNIAEAILSFTTSWETMPMVNAKPTMRVQFLPDDDSHELPTSSACLKIIRIPTVHSTQVVIDRPPGLSATPKLLVNRSATPKLLVNQSATTKLLVNQSHSTPQIEIHCHRLKTTATN